MIWYPEGPVLVSEYASPVPCEVCVKNFEDVASTEYVFAYPWSASPTYLTADGEFVLFSELIGNYMGWAVDNANSVGPEHTTLRVDAGYPLSGTQPTWLQEPIFYLLNGSPCKYAIGVDPETSHTGDYNTDTLVVTTVENPYSLLLLSGGSYSTYNTNRGCSLCNVEDGATCPNILEQYDAPAAEYESKRHVAWTFYDSSDSNLGSQSLASSWLSGTNYINVFYIGNDNTSVKVVCEDVQVHCKVSGEYGEVVLDQVIDCGTEYAINYTAGNYTRYITITSLTTNLGVVGDVQLGLL